MIDEKKLLEDLEKITMKDINKKISNQAERFYNVVSFLRLKRYFIKIVENQPKVNEVKI